MAIIRGEISLSCEKYRGFVTQTQSPASTSRQNSLRPLPLSHYLLTKAFTANIYSTLLHTHPPSSPCEPKMSSMRNAVQRRNHKERAQPAERAKWGILEKHKVRTTPFLTHPLPSPAPAKLQILTAPTGLLHPRRRLQRQKEAPPSPQDQSDREEPRRVPLRNGQRPHA